MDSILEMMRIYSESKPIDLVKDILFKPSIDPSSEPRVRAKRNHSSRTYEADNEAPMKKRERKNFELARRASLMDKEAR